MDKEMIGRCGTFCGVCDWREKTNCPGCQKASSRMFWGECLVAKCSIEKGFNHCGLCSELRCEKLQAAFDNPEHGDHGERLFNLKAWANGEKTYLKIGILSPNGNKDS